MGSMKIQAIIVAGAITLAIAPAVEAAGPLKLIRTGRQVGKTQETHTGFVARVRLSSDRGTVGKAKFRCRIRRDIADCTMKSRFSEGKIIARGPVHDGERHPTLPITGGSGLFRHARGELRFRPGAPRPSFKLVYYLEHYG